MLLFSCSFWLNLKVHFVILTHSLYIMLASCAQLFVVQIIHWLLCCKYYRIRFYHTIDMCSAETNKTLQLCFRSVFDDLDQWKKVNNFGWPSTQNVRKYPNYQELCYSMAVHKVYWSVVNVITPPHIIHATFMQALLSRWNMNLLIFHNINVLNPCINFLARNRLFPSQIGFKYYPPCHSSLNS